MAEAKKASSDDQATIKEIKDRLADKRWLVERNWFGNILYHHGHQWVSWDPTARRWRQRKLSPSVPTPVTNLYRSTIDTVKSALAQHEPRFLGTPERDDPRCVAAASSADTNLQIILKQARFKVAKRRKLGWMLLTGNAFTEIVWDDSDETGLDAVPKEMCRDCLTYFDPNELDANEAVCTECGSPFLVEATDQFVWAPRGRMRYDVLSPFEVYLDPQIEELEDQPYVLIVQSYTPEQVYLKWGYDMADESGAVTEMGLQSRDALASVAAGGVTSPFGAGGSGRDKRIVVFRLYAKYHKKYKDGAYVAMTSSGKLLEKVTPYPWKDRAGQGQKFYPLIHDRFGTSEGRAWGYTPADDLLPKQYQLNKAESMMSMIMTRMANPVWMIPANTNPTRLSGEIGAMFEYTPVGNAAPTRVPGAEAPQSLVKYIEDIRKAFDELSGAFAAVRGRSMGSRTPVGTVQTLQASGFGRWATVFQMLEEGYEDMAVKSLEIWRQKSKTPAVASVKNAVGGFTFHEFMAADLADGVDVQVEAGSARPNTQQEKRQAYVELAQIGLLDFTDEAQKVRALEDTGMLYMRAGVQDDMKAAYKENADFMLWAREFGERAMQLQPGDQESLGMLWQEAMTRPPVIVTPIIDDHALHYLTHRRLALTEEFKTLPEMVKQFFYQHVTQHMVDLPLSKINAQTSMIMGQAQQGGAQGAASKGQGKPGAGPGGGSPQNAPTKQMQGGESNPDGNQ